MLEAQAGHPGRHSSIYLDKWRLFDEVIGVEFQASLLHLLGVSAFKVDFKNPPVKLQDSISRTGHQNFPVRLFFLWLNS